MHRRTGLIWGAVALAVVLCACLCLAGLIGAGFMSRTQTRMSDAISTEFQVNPAATLDIRNPVGNVTVEAGTEGVVVVRARREVRARLNLGEQNLLDRITIRTHSEAQRASIVVDLPKGLWLQSAKVDLTIMVPTSLDLDVVNEVGEVHIFGTEGNLRLRSDVGDIVLHDVTVAKECDATVDVGRIQFEGRLPERQGEVLLRTRVGSIQVAAPPGSRFALDAETRLGEVNSGFELKDAQSGKASDKTGMWLRGYANGAQSSPKLVLRAETGDIQILPGR